MSVEVAFLYVPVFMRMHRVFGLWTAYHEECVDGVRRCCRVFKVMHVM